MWPAVNRTLDKGLRVAILAAIEKKGVEERHHIVFAFDVTNEPVASLAKDMETFVEGCPYVAVHCCVEDARDLIANMSEMKNLAPSKLSLALESVIEKAKDVSDAHAIVALLKEGAFAACFRVGMVSVKETN